MPLPQNLQTTFIDFVDRKKQRLIDITRQLVQTPSENKPPNGAEAACQHWLAGQLQNAGLQPDLYEIGSVPGLCEHPLYFQGRSYDNRPNLAARRAGSGKGRSLLLSGHIDTVPIGTQPWTRQPLGAQVEGNRIYGRGSNDMKAGIAANLFVLECVQELGLKLRGDLTFESVIDEEFGGCNGTLAGRVRGYNADAVILAEPSSLRICAAQRGGRTAQITFHSSGGVLQDGAFPSGVVPQLTQFLSRVPEFAAQRSRSVPVHKLYATHSDPVPVSVTKVFTAPWGYGEPITIPESGQIELYWQLMPGEQQAEVEQEFFDWLRRVVEEAPGVFPAMPDVSMPIRWLPGSAIDASHSLVQELSTCAQAVLGEPPVVTGIEGPCDLFVFHQAFNMPGVLWGPRGGNVHAADEYVEIDSLVAASKALLLFVATWCGID